jgi:hypothetical protein
MKNRKLWPLERRARNRKIYTVYTFYYCPNQARNTIDGKQNMIPVYFYMKFSWKKFTCEAKAKIGDIKWTLQELVDTTRHDLTKEIK